MQSIYMEWYSSEVIPPARPVLLIKDGHAFHISNRVLELSCENNIHSSCPHLPYLQPQDFGGIQCNFLAVITLKLAVNPDHPQLQV